jgi:nicotinamidase-related amidase
MENRAMESLDPARTALLVMDAQESIVGQLGERPHAPIAQAATLVAAARAAQLPVIHVVIGFRPGYPEMSPQSPMHARVTTSGRFTGPPGADIVEALRPAPGEPLVIKHRVSAFSGSDLEMILRARGAATLVLAGYITSGVVLSTLRQAADLDFRVVVVADACADHDDEVHRVLTEKVFPRQATVASARDVVAAL